jgi:hypothetical protein
MNLSSQQIEIELVVIELHSFNSNTLEIDNVKRNGKPLHEKHTGS